MKVLILFDTDNAAFEDDPIAEVQYLFDQCINALDDIETASGRKLVDSNGNVCGRIEIGKSDS